MYSAWHREEIMKQKNKKLDNTKKELKMGVWFYNLIVVGKTPGTSAHTLY